MLRKIIEEKIKRHSKEKKASTSVVVASTSEETHVIEEPVIEEPTPVVEEPVVGKNLESESSIQQTTTRAKQTTTRAKGRQVICLTTGEIFDTIKQAKEKYRGSIDRACQGKQKTAGVHPETGEKLRWMYYDEYLNGSDVQ